MNDTDDTEKGVRKSEFVDSLSTAVEEALNKHIETYLEDYEGGSGLTEDEVRDLIEEYSSDGGLSEDAVRDLINEEVEHPESGLSEDEVLDLIEQYGGGGDGSGLPSHLIQRAEKALSRLELMTGLRGETRRVGPSGFSGGGYHDNPLWGIRFTTKNPLYLSRASVDAEGDGSFHVKCWSFTDDGLGDVAAEQVVQIVEGQQRIPLEMNLDPGEYLLARPSPEAPEDAPDDFSGLPDSVFEPDDDDIGLWRGEHDGWEADSGNGVTFIGGAHPVYDDEQAVDLWYYFTDLAMTIDRDEDEDESEEDSQETTAIDQSSEPLY